MTDTHNVSKNTKTAGNTPRIDSGRRVAIRMPNKRVRQSYATLGAFLGILERHPKPHLLESGGSGTAHATAMSKPLFEKPCPTPKTGVVVENLKVSPIRPISFPYIILYTRLYSIRSQQDTTTYEVPSTYVLNTHNTPNKLPNRLNRLYRIRLYPIYRTIIWKRIQEGKMLLYGGIKTLAKVLNTSTL